MLTPTTERPAERRSTRPPAPPAPVGFTPERCDELIAAIELADPATLERVGTAVTMELARRIVRADLSLSEAGRG